MTLLHLVNHAYRRALQELTRWVIPPHTTIDLVVQFSSPDVGKFSELLTFDVACGERPPGVAFAGTCDFPHISTDARNLYFRTARVRPSTPSVSRQYIQASGTFEFGPLLAGKDRSVYLSGANPEHAAAFRITNNGKFDLRAEFWLKSQGPEPPTVAVDAKGPAGKKAAPGAKGAEVAGAGKGGQVSVGFWSGWLQRDKPMTCAA